MLVGLAPARKQGYYGCRLNCRRDDQQHFFKAVHLCGATCRRWPWHASALPVASWVPFASNTLDLLSVE